MATVLGRTARRIGLYTAQEDGPWPCERCGWETQYAFCTKDETRVFCKNENCRFRRTIDLKARVIVEDDGSVWRYDPATGNKWRIHRR